MTSDLDAALEGQPLAPPTLSGARGKAAKCRQHKWRYGTTLDPWENRLVTVGMCFRCGATKDEVRSKRGKQSRNYGNRAELTAARKYGGVKVGQAGGPTDIRGKDFNTQMKTHRRAVPAEWRKVFGALEASGERCPRLLLRFVQGPGVAPADYFVFPADAFLDWFGRDE